MAKFGSEWAEQGESKGQSEEKPLWLAAQERELGQLDKRAKDLNSLLICFANRLEQNALPNEPPDVPSALSYREIHDYSNLIQRHISGVLIYQKVAQHWQPCFQERAQALIQAVIVSHEYLQKVLSQQTQALGLQLESLQLPNNWKSNHVKIEDGQGKLIDLQR